jgi:lipid II:glycine glycyltransferase (peptidoglycan interpeptide bridge formation enzyme)
MAGFMNLEIKIVNPLEHESWDKYVLGFKEHTFFHSSGWIKVLKETYGYQPLVFCVNNKERVAAIFPLMQVNSILTGRRGVSLPFSDFCASIFLDEDVASAAMKKLLDFGSQQKWKYIELRGNLISVEKHSSYTSYYHHEVNLDDEPELVFKNFRNSTKRNIKKSISEGVTVHVSASFDAIKQFYVLNCITRRRHGLPPQPFRLFKNIYEHIVLKENGFVVTAEWNGKVIGASVYLHFGDKAVYKYGASDHSCQHLRANNLIMWEAIKWYCKNGYKAFSFGRTDVDHEGLLQFKRGWGAREEEVPYYRFDPRSGKALIKGAHNGSLFTKYSSKLPIAALRTFGELMYRHVG